MAAVKVDIKINKPKLTRFRVAGDTLAEAKRNLDRLSEWGTYDSTQNGKSDARTDKAGDVVSVTMEINPIIELPEWGGYGSATKEQKASWDTMVAALEAHERRHHDIQIDFADKLKTAMKKAKPLTVAIIDDLITDNQKDCQRAQDSYDTRSKHGEKEGVELDLDA